MVSLKLQFLNFTACLTPDHIAHISAASAAIPPPPTECGWAVGAMPPKGVMKGPGDLPYSHAHAMRDDYAAFVHGFMKLNKGTGEFKEIAQQQGPSEARNALIYTAESQWKGRRGATKASEADKARYIAAARKLSGISAFVERRPKFAAAAASGAAEKAVAVPRPPPADAAVAEAEAEPPAAEAGGALPSPQPDTEKSIFDFLSIPGKTAIAMSHAKFSSVAPPLMDAISPSQTGRKPV